MAGPVKDDTAALQDETPGIDGNSVFKAVRLPVEQELAGTSCAQRLPASRRGEIRLPHPPLW